MKITLYIVCFLVLLSTNSCFETCEENRKKLHIDEHFFGRIDTIFLDLSRKNQPFVRLNNIDYIVINSIYEQFSIGDTLFKNSGSMKYYWIKNGDTTIFYQKCGTRDIDEVRD